MRLLFYSSVFLILYGSLYPFDFSLNALTDTGIERFLYTRSLFSSRGDELGNIALFIPYGFLEFSPSGVGGTIAGHRVARSRVP